MMFPPEELVARVEVVPAAKSRRRTVLLAVSASQRILPVASKAMPPGVLNWAVLWVLPSAEPEAELGLLLLGPPLRVLTVV